MGLVWVEAWVLKKNPGLDEFKKLSRVSSPRVTLEFDSSHYQSNLLFLSPLPLSAISPSFQFKRTRCLGIRSVLERAPKQMGKNTAEMRTKKNPFTLLSRQCSRVYYTVKS